MPAVDKKRKEIAARLLKGERLSDILVRVPQSTREEIEDVRGEINPATPETKAKLKRDPLLALYCDELIGTDELYAANHIRRAYRLRTADSKIKSMKFTGRVDLFRGQFVDEKNIDIVLQQQYKEWFHWCAKDGLYFDAIIHILMEVGDFEDSDEYFGLVEGSTALYLEKGLKLYVELFSGKRGKQHE